MNKEEIIAKLTELGIEFDETAKKVDLLALLPEEKKDEVVAITFKLSNGMTRVFDAETNGDGFEDLAKEFEVTNAGKIVEKL